MNWLQLERTYRALEFGFQLTLEEQRELWNAMVRCVTGDGFVNTEVIKQLGELPELCKCSECNGTGKWGEDYEWGLMTPFMCLACNGSGNKHGVDVVASE